MESQRQAFSGRARARAPLSGLTGTVRVEGRGGVRGRRGSGFPWPRAGVASGRGSAHSGDSWRVACLGPAWKFWSL